MIPTKQSIIFFSIATTISFLTYAGFKKHKADNTVPPETQNDKPITALDSILIEFDQYVASGLDSNNYPGVAYCIVKDTGIIAMETKGVRNTSTMDSIDENTVFRLASVSKGFASLLTALFVQKGLLSYDYKVQDYISGFKLKDSINTADLNINHVLCHTSGLVPHAYDNLVEDHVPVNDIITQLCQVDICCHVGKVYGYQNVVFSLAGIILEKITGKTYAELLFDEIFSPLGMNNSSADFTSIKRTHNKALPHIKINDNWINLELEDTYYSVAPAAGVNSSISDISKWLMMLLGIDNNIIDSVHLNELFQPRIQTPLKYSYTRHWDNITDKYYAYGWRIYKFNNMDIINHAGYVKGYRSEIAIFKDKKIGIAVLTNGPGRYASKLVPTFFKLYFDRMKPPDAKNTNENEHGLQAHQSQ